VLAETLQEIDRCPGVERTVAAAEEIDVGHRRQRAAVRRGWA
jgi:hypothetical protein